MNFNTEICGYINKVAETLQNLDVAAINAAMDLLLKTLENEGSVYIFGNGGSALTASHFASDFNKGLSEGLSKKFNFICLNDNIGTVMAIANDISYGDIFVYQLEGRLKQNDLVMGISGSGNSANIIKVAEYAKSLGVKVIGITGYDGGRLKPLADVSLHANIYDMQVAEDIHLIFNHMMMQILRIYLKKEDC